MRRQYSLFLVAFTACLFSSVAARAECPDIREEIEASFKGNFDLYAIDRGSTFVYSKQADGSLCTLRHSKEGLYVFETRAQAESITAQSGMLAKGDWRFRNDENGGFAARLTFGGESSGEISVDGDASYTNSLGSVSVGYFEGTLNGTLLSSDHVTHIPAIGESASPASQTCFLDIRAVGSLLVVLDSGKANGKCGGENVTFTGVYRRM